MTRTLCGRTSGSRSLTEVDNELRVVKDSMQKLQDDIAKNSRSLELEKDVLQRSEIRFNHAKQNCLELLSMAKKHKRLKREKDGLSSSMRSFETKTDAQAVYCIIYPAKILEAS